MEIQPQKIKLARMLRRMSMDQLVTAMREDAVSKMAISKIERGQLVPSAKTLQAVARACQVPVEFFSSPSYSIGSLNFRFRKVHQRRRNSRSPHKSSQPSTTT